MDKLDALGFNSWFKSRLDTEKSSAHDIARVISVHKDRYTIRKGLEATVAEVSGNLLYTANSSIDLPTTGDWVYADFYDEETHAIIYGVLPRRTLLKRKTSGKLVDFQLISANIDTAFVVQSVDYNFNLRRLERYLVMVNEGGITPIILLSKCDLISQSEVDDIKIKISNIAPHVSILELSSLTGKNLNTLKESLFPGYTYCLLGSSGVGKTTLLNSILGSERFETQAVSKKQSKGRHTTTSRELIQLDSGAILIDTPGMRELGNISVDTGIDETFSEIAEIALGCKYSNCSHNNEKGCAILFAIKEGLLSQERFDNYLKMINESKFNEMSYFEKRQKDKDFGKLIKSTMKHKRK